MNAAERPRFGSNPRLKWLKTMVFAHTGSMRRCASYESMRMPSAKLGTRTSGAEVTNVSTQGFWILIGDQEKFVSFDDFPWFLEVPIGPLMKVKLQGQGHLYWPEIDVDLAVESIDHPERFPLVSKQRPNMRMHLTKSPRKVANGRAVIERRLRR